MSKKKRSKNKNQATTPAPSSMSHNPTGIPGYEILQYQKGKSENIYYKKIEYTLSTNFGFQDYDSKTLLTPVVSSFFIKAKEDVLRICTTAFVNQTQDILSFRLFYNYTLSNIGEPQISIYIWYYTIDNSATTYSINSFDIYFKGESIVNFDMYGSVNMGETKIGVKNIKKVQVFLINGDPETSRGTTTTVQTHNS